MKIAIASDHAGFELKNFVRDYLAGLGHGVKDFGTDSEESVDYPDYAEPVCRSVLSGQYERGVLVCGTGAGMSISANRFKGIRAVLCTGLYLAEYSRLHNDSNVLCLPGRVMGKGVAEKTIDIWLKTPFEGGRHERRIKKIDELG